MPRVRSSVLFLLFIQFSFSVQALDIDSGETQRSYIVEDIRIQ